jgi:hypothetical protein
VLYAQLWDGGERVPAILTALRAVIARHGLPMALYTDRRQLGLPYPASGTGPDRRRLTQVGRALARLGIEHILGFSPQARGRSERVNRTLQDRLVNEYRLAGITTLAAANRYLRDRFMPAFNAEFGRPPADPAPAFAPLGATDLDQILCVEEERVVAPDNVRHHRPRRLAARQAARPPVLRRAAGPGPAPSQRRPLASRESIGRRESSRLRSWRRTGGGAAPGLALQPGDRSRGGPEAQRTASVARSRVRSRAAPSDHSRRPGARPRPSLDVSDSVGRLPLRRSA